MNQVNCLYVANLMMRLSWTVFANLPFELPLLLRTCAVSVLTLHTAHDRIPRANNSRGILVKSTNSSRITRMACCKKPFSKYFANKNEPRVVVNLLYVDFSLRVGNNNRMFPNLPRCRLLVVVVSLSYLPSSSYRWTSF